MVRGAISGRFGGWVACAVVACSAACSNGAVTKAPTSSPEGGSPDGASPADDGAAPPSTDASGTVPDKDSGVRATACTAAPFVSYAAALTTLDLSGATQPLAGAKIGFSTCPGFEITTDATGKAATQLTQGIAVSPIYNAGPTLVGTIGAELSATTDASPAVAVFAFDVTPSIPGFLRDGGNAATIAVVLQPDAAATGACAQATGVTLAVTGHPEAVVSYAGTGWPANPSVTTTSSTGSYVFINGVQGASSVTVTGAKAGCTVSLTTGSQTGRFVLVPGSVTVGVAAITN